MKMVDGHKGLTYGTVTITLELEDSLRRRKTEEIQCCATNINGFDIILGRL